MNSTEFIHPTDRALTEKIYAVGAVKTWMDNAFEEGLDDVCRYVYSASCPEETAPVVRGQMDRACGLFGLKPGVPVYRRRSYEYDVACVGYGAPGVVVSSALLDRGDQTIIAGRLGAAAGSIAAGHPKLSFLLWTVESMSGAIPIPFLNEALLALLYQWNRVRVFTQDRAFLTAARDYELALKNILYGVIPFDILERMSFSERDGDFLGQVERYLNRNSAAQKVGTVFSLFQDYAWLPERYHELQKFYHQWSEEVCP